LNPTDSLRAALYNLMGSDSKPKVRCPFHTVLAILNVLPETDRRLV
jgi:hypothetical protein